MKLRTWLVKNKMRQLDFSKRIGCCRSHLSSVMSKRRPCGRILAEAIERETNGDITAAEVLFGDALGYERKKKQAGKPDKVRERVVKDGKYKKKKKGEKVKKSVVSLL